MKLELEIKQVRGKLLLQVPKMGVPLTIHEALTLLGFEPNERVILLSKSEHTNLVSEVTAKDV